MAYSPQVAVRLKPALKKAFEKAAAEDKRTVSALLLKLIEEYLEAQRKTRK